MSEILHRAREYEREHSALIPAEDRPSFHLTPRVGWMNDPNGFSVYQGHYHLFYQYHPYDTKWGPMHWGHAVSTDLLHWQPLGAAIAPDMPYDKDGCFSGSAIQLDDGRHLLMYTGVRREPQPDGSYLDYQTQCLAVGDGVNYVKYEGNPVITGGDVPAGFSVHDFRDPKLFRNPDGSFGCVVGNRSDDGSGAILLFTSPDGFHWKFSSILDRSRNRLGKMWECPDFFPLDGKDVIVTSPQQMHARGLEFHCGDCTMAILGKLEQGSMRRETVQAIDYGLDFYAPQTLESPDGRRIMIGWMQSWDTLGLCPAGAKWFGQMTTPRELTLREGRLIQNPVRELERCRVNPILHRDVPIGGEVSFKGVRGRMIDMTVILKPLDEKGFALFEIQFAKDEQYHTSLLYRPEERSLTLSRTHAGFTRDYIHQRECHVLPRNGQLKLRILLDKFSAEVFVNDGEQAMTATFYTPLSAEEITFRCSRRALVTVEKYDITMA